MNLFERARQLNPHIPGFSYIAPFMAHLYRAVYEQALFQAQKFRMPAFHVDPIARTVALSYLGRQASRTGDAGRNTWRTYRGFHEGT